MTDPGADQSEAARRRRRRRYSTDWDWGAWLRDPAVRALSLAARGVWADVLAYMTDSPIVGHWLTPAGTVPTAAEMGRMLGCRPATAARIKAEIVRVGAADLGPSGALVNRRMVRDEALRQTRSRAGRRGYEAARGNGTLPFGNDLPRQKTPHRSPDAPILPLMIDDKSSSEEKTRSVLMMNGQAHDTEGAADAGQDGPRAGPEARPPDGPAEAAERPPATMSAARGALAALGVARGVVVEMTAGPTSPAELLDIVEAATTNASANPAGYVVTTGRQRRGAVAEAAGAGKRAEAAGAVEAASTAVERRRDETAAMADALNALTPEARRALVARMAAAPGPLAAFWRQADAGPPVDPAAAPGTVRAMYRAHVAADGGAT